MCEYISTQFEKLCDKKDITSQLSVSYTLQPNGVVQKRNKTQLDMKGT